MQEGFGTPDWRIVAGLRVGTAGRAEKIRDAARVADSDRDGLFDDVDQCPREPEDKDELRGRQRLSRSGQRQGHGARHRGQVRATSRASVELARLPRRTPMATAWPTASTSARRSRGRRQLRGQRRVPRPDNDKDGVLDAADRCPIEPGSVDEQRLPRPGSRRRHGRRSPRQLPRREGRSRQTRAA